MDIPNLEERYMDVLQNIEFAIVEVHKRTPLLVDFDVENALSALINHYQAQMRGVALSSDASFRNTRWIPYPSTRRHSWTSVSPDKNAPMTTASA